MKIFKFNYEFYTFISGALISMSISLLFEAFKNKFSSNLCLNLSFLPMLLSSLFCFLLSLKAKKFQELYKQNIEIKEAIGDKDVYNNAWRKTIYVQENKKRLNGLSISLIIYLLMTIILCLGSMALYYYS